MRRPLAPLWLAAPSRFALLKRGWARGAAAGALLLVLLSLLALATAGPPPRTADPAKRAEEVTDVMLYEDIVAGVRAGGDYYAVTADALRRGDYPLKPFVTFRLPTLALMEAALPAPLVLALLYALALAVLGFWGLRLRPLFRRPTALAIALLLLLGGMAAFVQAELIAFHEVWAGLLIALSLALRREERWLNAVAFGLVAALVRELAALYLIAMAAMAWAEGRRREMIGWLAALSVLSLVIIAHAYGVSQVVHGDDPASPGWAGLLGPGFFFKTIAISTAFAPLPLALSAPLIALALIGWAGARGPLSRRVLATIGVYALLLALFGRTDTFYWGLLIAPLVLTGLAFAPDAVRDLAAAVLERRRITVTRAVR